MIRKALFGLAAASTLALAACQSGPTPYQPGSRYERGYTEQKIEAERYRITFSGNSLTDKDTVENYMLFRAAELTLQQGFDHFTIVDRDTDKKRQVSSTGGDYFGPRLSYMYFHPRYGWMSAYDPFWGPDWGPRTYREYTQYSASAEVLMGKGPKGDDPKAFDARDVEKNLGPLVSRPPQ
jgi:hypothetical protein